MDVLFRRKLGNPTDEDVHRTVDNPVECVVRHELEKGNPTTIGD